MARRCFMGLMEKLSTAVIEGKVDEIGPLTEEALKRGTPAVEIIDEGLMPGMNYVGVQFKNGDMFIPEVMISAQAMQAAMAILRPLLTSGETGLAGTVLIGTVKGDLHSIGKNMVAMMLVGAGFEVRDLGTDVPPEAFVQAVRQDRPDIVGMSALLTTTMMMLPETIDALAEADIRDEVKIMVGGAPVTADFAKEICADGYAPNAVAAVDLATSLIAT
jgi:5-methyltetrahydrofolate--homocysteine methyltransferase